MKKWLAAGVVTLALPVAALPLVAGASTAASASPVRASAACPPERRAPGVPGR